MKIKKIDFQHDKGESYDIYYAVLPVGHDARVELTCESKDTLDGNECWSWEIDTERYTDKCGVATSKELAMEACQAAWEKMVMESFEENRGCDFCHELGRYQRADLRDNGRGSIGTLINCSADNPKTNIKSNWSFVAKRHMEIQLIGGVLYCPFCGRKLPQGKEQDNDVFKYVREWEKKKNEEGES